MTGPGRKPKARPRVLCSDCPATIQKGDEGVPPVYGCCTRCRGRRGAQAANRTRRIHHCGFGRVAGRAKA